MQHVPQYLIEVMQIVGALDASKVEDMVAHLVALREREGRLWLVGLGGSLANASHAANDFRKLCGIEAYAPDNMAEFSAWMNDEGLHHVFTNQWWRRQDMLMVLSVGGGTDEVSVPIGFALRHAQDLEMTILGIVGRDGGMTARFADCAVIVPTVAPGRVTPHTEAFQSVILHCLVSHPDLQRSATKW